MQVQPYLFFNGHCEEAAQYYGEKLGAQIDTLMRFTEMPEAEKEYIPQGFENKVLHMSLRIGENTILASDGMGEKETRFEGFSLTLIVPTSADAERLFNALAADGKVEMPLSPTFFSANFGAVADKFGVSWMIYAEK